MSDLKTAFAGIKTKDITKSLGKSLTPKGGWEEAAKDPFSSESLKQFATTGAHGVTKDISERRKVRDVAETATIKAEEEALVEKERVESETAALKKKRGLRKRATARKGRRASIVTGPLGAAGEPEIRRATLG